MTEVTVKYTDLSPTEFTIWRSLDAWSHNFTEHLREVTEDILNDRVPADRYGDDEDRSIPLDSIEAMVKGWFIDNENGTLHPNCGGTEPEGVTLYVWCADQDRPDYAPHMVNSVTEMVPSPDLKAAAASMKRILDHWDEWAKEQIAKREAGNA